MRHRERLQPTPAHVGAAAGVLTFVSAAAASTGALLLAGLLLVTGVGLYLRGDDIAEYLSVPPDRRVIEHIEPGLTDKEVEEFSTLHNEYLTIQEEERKKREKEMKKNRGGGGRHLNKK